MIKILRVVLGTALGLFLAQYFVANINIQGFAGYLWGTLILVAVLFIVRGFKF